MLLQRLARAFQKEGLSFAVAGGYAVALHGAVRGTVDVDVVLKFARRDFLAAEKIFKSLGLISRLPVDAGQVFDFREDYIKNRNLIAWSFHNPANPAEIVDVIITHDLNKMKIARIKLGNDVIPIVSRRDLIAMKTKSGRPQDIEDVKALEALG